MSIDSMNWARNPTYRAEKVCHPNNVDDLQDLIVRSARVRALGTRHSFNEIADTSGVQISLAALDADIRIDSSAMTASVTGGTPFGVLISELQRQGFALLNTGSLPHISVAGATATGTHGSGDSNGILSTAIGAVEFVAADGSLVTVDRSSEHLSALAVGLGAFGVITRLTFDIQPSYLVRQDVYRHAPWETVLERLDEVMASAYSVSLLADFASPTVMQLLWLSPAYRQDILCIGFTWAKHPMEVAPLLTVIEDALEPYAPRPHWGKLFNFGADVVGPRFPRLNDFMAVRNHYDPHGKFWNPFLEDKLGEP